MSYRTKPYLHVKLFNSISEATEHIKWCRRNLGERGRDCDFSGSLNVSIVIYTPKYVSFYSLIYE